MRFRFLGLEIIGCNIYCSVFFLGEISQLVELLFLNEKNKKNCDYQGFFPPFSEIQIIKLATSRLRHFLGHHL